MAILAVLVVVAAAGCATSGAAHTPMPTPSPATASASPSASPSVAAPPASPTTSASCLAALTARVVQWDAGAGSRMATVELKNPAAAACAVPALSPELVDAASQVLIAADPAVAAPAVTLGPGKVVKAIVRVANVCAASVAAPVTVGLLGGGVTLLATPAAASTDAVPPCNGDPGSAGHIEIGTWGA